MNYVKRTFEITSEQDGKLNQLVSDTGLDKSSVVQLVLSWGIDDFAEAVKKAELRGNAVDLVGEQLKKLKGESTTKPRAKRRAS